MAYDRYERGKERSRWSDDDRYSNRERGRTEFSRDQGRADYRDRDRGDRDDRGFFERAGDEISSWFGDEEAERRREQDRRREEREGRMGDDRERGWDRDRDENRGTFFGRDRDDDRGRYWRERSWGSGDYERDEDRFRQGGSGSRDRDPRRERERGYRPVTGDYGRGGHESEQFFAASGVGRGERGAGERSDYGRSQSPWGRDEYRGTSRAGTSDWSDRSRETGVDPHYRSWRDRHLSELDRDYDDYRREHQSKFESDFGSWRERRQQKRGLAGQIREHMEVVGNDNEHVGRVDRIAGDRIILTKGDAEAGGVHHSLSCVDVDRIEGDRVILDCSAAQARERWRDEDRGRALFEREDQGEMGPRVLDRSFQGTYR